MADRPPPSALQENASFAAKFIGGTTNLAQRRRYQEDIQAAMDERTDMEQRQFELANQRAELADPLKARQVRAMEQRLEYGADQFEARETRLTEQQKLERDALDLRIGKENLAKSKYEAATASQKMKDAHEAAFFKGMADAARRGLRPGTQAFASFVGDLVDANYAADDKYLADALKTARLDASTSDFLAQKARLREQGIESKITIKVGPDGRESFGLTEYITPTPKPVKTADPRVERRAEYSEYKVLVDLFNKEGDPEFKKILEKKVQDKRAQIMGTGGTTDQPAPVQAPAAPTTEKPIIRMVPDGQGGYKPAG